jgi:hypothetical protein
MKARVVTDGSMQDKSLYRAEETSSPTVQLNSILTLATIAAAKGLKVKTMDIAQAYLNASMPKEVLVSMDPKVAD